MPKGKYAPEYKNEKPQPYSVGKGMVNMKVPSAPGVSTAKNPKVSKSTSGPGPAWGSSPKR